MRRLYSNPNDRFRTLHTERVVRLDPRLVRGEEAEGARTPGKVRPLARRGYSARHIREMMKHMKHIRRCRKQGKRPRNVPLKVLQTIVAWNLV